MNTVLPIFITDITVFEAYSKKHKPVSVNGRGFCSLTYRHRGKASIKCGERELCSDVGDVTFVPRGVDYITEIYEEVHVTAIHFNFIGADAPTLPSVMKVNDTKVEALFLALAKTANDQAHHFKQLSIVYELFDELYKMKSAIDGGAFSEKIVRAKEIVGRSYVDPYFSIERLAEELKISTTYLRREFCRATGMSPIAYLKDTRLREASRLLLANDLTVKEIAERCGYSSISYFIQDFHKKMGESPSQYRQRLRAAP